MVLGSRSEFRIKSTEIGESVLQRYLIKLYKNHMREKRIYLIRRIQEVRLMVIIALIDDDGVQSCNENTPKKLLTY